MSLLKKFVSNYGFSLLVLLLFIADGIYSYNQYSHDYIDGDLPKIIVPSESYRTVLKDPLGLRIIFEQERYPATNRFTNHFFAYSYFRIVPGFFRDFTSPVKSVFLSLHALKLFTHLLLVTIIVLYVRLFSKKFKLDHGFVALLGVFPFLFTTYNFEYIALLDYSISYTMAYAFFLV